MKQFSTSPFSTASIFRESFIFVRRNFGEILRRTWLLAIIGYATFSFFFGEYTIKLEGFLAAPTQAHASILLGLFSISVLLLLFVVTLAVAAVTNLALGDDRKSGLFSIRISYQEFRLYAAWVRLLLLMITLIALASLIGWAIQGGALGYAVETGIVAILVAIALRMGFLLPAVAIAEPRGVIIRRSWNLSEGIVPQLFLFTIAVALPGIVIEVLGELVVRATRLLPILHANGSLRDNIAVFRLTTPIFSILFCVPVMLITLLYAIASAKIYQARTGDPLPPN